VQEKNGASLSGEDGAWPLRPSGRLSLSGRRPSAPRCACYVGICQGDRASIRSSNLLFSHCLARGRLFRPFARCGSRLEGGSHSATGEPRRIPISPSQYGW